MLRLITQASDSIAIAANVVGTLTVLTLVGVINFDVVARGVFNSPFQGAVEVVQFAMVLIVFLQLPDVVRVGRLTRSDGFLLIAGAKFPRIAKVMRSVIDLIAAIFMLFIAIAMWPEFVEMWESEDFFGIPGVFTAPWWPIKLTVFISAVLCSLMFLLKVIATVVAKTGDSSAEQDAVEGAAQ